MIESIIDKLKEEKGTFTISSDKIEDILELIDTAENLSEEIGYYSNKKWKDNLKQKRDQVYDAIVEIIHLNKL